MDKLTALKDYWLKTIKSKSTITIETGKAKGVMPNTVKAFAKANDLKLWNPNQGVYVVSEK